MGVSTVRPNATVQLGPYTTLVGAATAHAALSDATGTAGDADSTAVDLTSSAYDATRGLILDLPAFSIPANARITGVRIRFRARDNSSYPFDSLLRAQPRLIAPNGSVYNLGVGVASNWGATTMTYYVGAYETTSPSQAEWTAADLGNLQVLIVCQTQFFGSGGRVAEVWVDAQYDEQPVVTVTAPAESAVSGTMFPSVGWTYSDPDGSPMDAAFVKIFNAAQYGAGGFNPETSAAVASSGWIGSTNPGAWTTSVPLPNDSYRAYVKARQAFGSGYFESAWDFNAFSVNVTPPPTPTLAAVAVQDGAVTLTATRGGTTPATDGYEFQYQDAAGTWQALRSGTVVGSGTTAATVDYEAPPNTARSYRVRAYRVSSGFLIVSAWSNTVAATVVTTRWRLVDPFAASTGIPVRLQGDSMGHSSEEQTQVLWPLGRRNPVVISGTIQGETFSLTFLFASEADYLAFEAMRNTQHVLLLKSARTTMWYLKLTGGRAVTEDRTTADIAPYWYTVTVAAVEQDIP